MVRDRGLFFWGPSCILCRVGRQTLLTHHSLHIYYRVLFSNKVTDKVMVIITFYV